MTLNKRTYLETIIPNNMFLFSNSKSISLEFWDSFEILKFLNTLESDTAYVVTFEFVYSWLSYELNGPFITLSKPILITKNSNPRVIAIFLKEKIQKSVKLYSLDSDIVNNTKVNKVLDSSRVIVKYNSINLY